MDDLVQWLRVALDEEEAAARAATKDQWIADGTRVTDAAGSTLARMAVPSGMYQQRMADAAHIAHHDPARVLREVEAKRRIIADCEPDYRDSLTNGDDTTELATEVLRLLALPYADRAGFREEWRP